jgi:predicted amidohydrolase
MEWESAAGLHNVAFVISRDGTVVGYQAKNQIPLQEEPFYVPDGRRRLFEVDGVPFGITICHEGWRYPESVRWSAARGARVVFHPQLTGSDQTGLTVGRWGDPSSPYYEKAMVARSVENTIYFASVNYAMRYQESATSLLGPEETSWATSPTARSSCWCTISTFRGPLGSAPGGTTRPSIRKGEGVAAASGGPPPALAYWVSILVAGGVGVR